MFAAISFNLFLNNAAGANSFVNKNTCAPPDLDLNTVSGNFFATILSISSL